MTVLSEYQYPGTDVSADRGGSIIRVRTAYVINYENWMQPFRFSRLRLLNFIKQKREDSFAFLPSHFRFVKNQRRKREMGPYTSSNTFYTSCAAVYQ